MDVSKFVLKLRLYKDEQKSEIFCSSLESASYRIPSNIKLTFRTFTVFSSKTPKNLLSEQVTSSTGMAVSSISGFALRSICTRLVILWWTHFFLHCHFLFSPLPLNKRKGHSSSRSSENKRPFGFSLCYWIKNVNSIRMCFIIPDAILLTLRCHS